MYLMNLTEYIIFPQKPFQLIALQLNYFDLNIALLSTKSLKKCHRILPLGIYRGRVLLTIPRHYCGHYQSAGGSYIRKYGIRSMYQVNHKTQFFWSRWSFQSPKFKPQLGMLLAPSVWHQQRPSISTQYTKPSIHSHNGLFLFFLPK